MTCKRSPKRLQRTASKDRTLKGRVQQSLRIRRLDNREKEMAFPRTDLFAHDTQYSSGILTTILRTFDGRLQSKKPITQKGHE
jgi:hypothetical protein